MNAERIENANVLVEGNLIKTVSTSAIKARGATLVDGGGRTLMPGLIENHAHLMLMGPRTPLAAGQKVDMTLTFRSGTQQQLSVSVEPR